MRLKAWLTVGVCALSFLTYQHVAARISGESGEHGSGAKLSETDTYIDLNTGKPFKVIYDGLNEIYNREDLLSFDLYVNTRTKDTLWQDNAIVVNHALLRDAKGQYRIDPMRVKRDGNSYKVVLPVVRK